LINKNIIKYYGYSIGKDGKFFIITEYANNGSLEQYLENNELTIDEKLKILTDICKGVNYLHSLEKPIIHKDLIPKNIFINDVMLKTGCHLWRKNATTEDLKKVSLKGLATKLNIQHELLELYLNNKTNWKLYRQVVDYITHINYYKYKHMIDPNSLRGPNYHLDHKFSVKAGFVSDVDPNLIGSWYNLCLLPANENLVKNAKSSITLEELLEMSNGKI